MATFFGIKGTELKKVKLIAKREENIRSTVVAAQESPLAVGEP
jgi:hypothetical protein